MKISATFGHEKRLKPGAVPSVFTYNWTTKSDWQWLPLMKLNTCFRFRIQNVMYTVTTDD